MIESASGLLSLPRFGPEVPSVLEAATGVADVTAIAAGLYRAGLLREDDLEDRLMYTMTGGGLIQSVTNALQRNLQEAIRESELYGGCQLVWTNKMIELAQGSPEVDDGARYGAFYVTGGAPDLVIVKPGIDVLEEYEPGFGYALAAVLYTALEDTANCFSYSWAYFLRHDWWNDYYDNYFEGAEEGEESNGKTTLSEDQKEFLRDREPDKGLPKEFRAMKFNRACLKRVAKRETDNEYAWLAKLALTLSPNSKPLDRTSSSSWLRYDGYMGSVMRYSDEDTIGTLFDDYGEHLMNGGEECDQVWISPFNLDPEKVDVAVDFAVAQLAEWFRRVGIAARLFDWFNDAYDWFNEKKQEEKVRIQV